MLKHEDTLKHLYNAREHLKKAQLHLEHEPISKRDEQCVTGCARCYKALLQLSREVYHSILLEELRRKMKEGVTTNAL
jgi:hypothetical protein